MGKSKRANSDPKRVRIDDEAIKRDESRSRASPKPSTATPPIGSPKPLDSPSDPAEQDFKEEPSLLDQEEEEEEEEAGGVTDDQFKFKVKNSGRTNEELRGLIEAMSEEQLQRYEAYRRSSLNRSTTRKLVSSILNQQISQTLAMVVAGFSKVFVGEIVELALDIKKEWELKERLAKAADSEEEEPALTEQADPLIETPLGPHHLREAYRRYQLNQSLSGPRGPISPATPELLIGIPNTIRRPKSFFRR